MPSFDAVLEPDMVAIKNSVVNAQKEIATRFDFKGTAAALELKDKDKLIELVGDSDFQIEQVSQVLVGKLTKQGVTINYLDMSAKIEKIGGDRVRQPLQIKAGIDSDTARRIQGAIKQSKLKVQAAIQGDTVRVSGAKRDDLQSAIALLKREITDVPLSFNNFRD